jgi:predicted XRE-type DNA-binding protein
MLLFALFAVAARSTIRTPATATGTAVRLAIAAGRRRDHRAVAERGMRCRILNCSGALATLDGYIGTATCRRIPSILSQCWVGEDHGEKNDRKNAFHVQYLHWVDRRTFNQEQAIWLGSRQRRISELAVRRCERVHINARRTRFSGVVYGSQTLFPAEFRYPPRLAKPADTRSLLQ